MACGVECMMSREDCPPAAIISVFINCIVDGGGAAGWMRQKYLTFGFCRIVKNVWWEIYLSHLTALGFFVLLLNASLGVRSLQID